MGERIVVNFGSVSESCLLDVRIALDHIVIKRSRQESASPNLDFIVILQGPIALLLQITRTFLHEKYYLYIILPSWILSCFSLCILTTKKKPSIKI